MKINHKEVTIITACPLCGHANEVEVNEDDYWDWQDGELVKNAFPYLAPSEREMLISGTCPKCWNNMFKDDEEDEECFEPDHPINDIMALNP